MRIFQKILLVKNYIHFENEIEIESEVENIMKQTCIILLVILLISCGSTKKAVEKTSEVSKVETVTPPNPPETPKPSETETELTESIEVVTSDGKVIGETDTMESAEQMLKEHNSKKNSLSTQQEITKINIQTHQLFDQLLKQYVLEDGKVDYQNFNNSHEDLLKYIGVLQLKFPEIEEVSKKEKLTYWINAYNALTIDLILRNYPLKSIKDIDKPWDQRLWKFGNKWLNLNDIEHKILRKMGEPRIHFAIVCASESCPKLQNFAYTAENLDTQLTKATKEFLADTSKNEITENHIKLSKIFKWFAKDFKTNCSLIDFLNQYSDVKISSKAKKSFKDYSWDLNE